MKKILILFFICAVNYVYVSAQPFDFAWISDLHVGSKEADENVIKVVNDINSKNFSMAVITGDITGAGSNKDLETAKQYLDKLKVKYYILPGNHDTKRSESGCVKFINLWGSENFLFEQNGICFIGLNSALYFRGHGGHLTPETLTWLEKKLAGIDKNKPVIILLHHFGGNNWLDNWFELTNRIKQYNVKAILCGHGHKNTRSDEFGVPVIMARATLTNKNGWGYCSVSVTNDSLFVFEENRGEKRTKLYGISKSMQNKIPFTDSLHFINYNTNVLANIETKKTCISGIFADNKNIALASNDGTISCFDAAGKLKWEYKTADAFISSPVICGGFLIAGSVQGNLYSFDCETGKVINKKSTGEAYTSRFTNSRLKHNGKLTDVVFTGSSFGLLSCYEAASLKLVWQNSDAKGLIECEPLIDDAFIYYGSWDTYLNKTDIASGKTLWRWQGDNKPYFSPAACKPVTDKKSVYIATPDNYVSSIDAVSGKTNWHSNKAECWESLGISADKSVLYVKGASGKFYSVLASDGRAADSLKFQSSGDSMCSEIIETDGKALFTTQSGMVYSCEKGNILKPLLYLGAARAHKVIPVNAGVFAVSNMDGRIVIFKLNEKEK